MGEYMGFAWCYSHRAKQRAASEVNYLVLLFFSFLFLISKFLFDFLFLFTNFKFNFELKFQILVKCIITNLALHVSIIVYICLHQFFCSCFKHIIKDNSHIIRFRKILFLNV
jgi:hypothetical protein